MRESIGGTWLMGFVVVFIILFSAFLTISINYSRAFKVKNKIINMLEQSEGKVTFEEIKNEINGMGYTIGSEDMDIVEKRCEEKYLYLFEDNGSLYNAEKNDGSIAKDGGYCLVEIPADEFDLNSERYYKVTTFIRFEFPIIWQSVLVPISGETSPIFPWSE